MSEQIFVVMQSSIDSPASARRAFRDRDEAERFREENPGFRHIEPVTLE